MRFGDYEIIEYQSEFKRQVLQLLSPLWGPDLQTSSAYLEWKYDQNPYVDRPRLYLVLFDKQVVGIKGGFGMRWHAGEQGQAMQCLGDADAIVRPEHRRRGLLKALSLLILDELADSPYEYIITLSANQRTAASNLKLGWQNAGYLQTAHWQPKRGAPPKSSVRSIVRKLPLMQVTYRRLRKNAGKRPSRSVNQGSAFEQFDRNSAASPGYVAGNIRIQQAPQPRAMAELVERIGFDGRMRHVRDEQFFAWRYQNPRSDYRFLFWENIQLEGYLVLRSARYPKNLGVTIVDWEATDLEVRAKLLEKALQLGDFGAVSTWSESLSDEQKGLLLSAGFNFVEGCEQIDRGFYPPVVLVRPVRKERLHVEWIVADRPLLELASWDLRAIYSDGS